MSLQDLRIPQQPLRRRLVGNCNLLDATVLRRDDSLTLSSQGLGSITAPARAGVAAGTRGVLALRPEMVRIFGTDAATAESQGLVNRFHGKMRERTSAT